jgi:hypothetical protein
MKRITPILVFLFFLGCLWFGCEGFPKFCDWTRSIGINDEIAACCPYMVAGGMTLLMTCMYYALKGVSD